MHHLSGLRANEASHNWVVLNDDYPVAVALLKDATASSVLSNMSNTVTRLVIRSASFMWSPRLVSLMSPPTFRADA